MIFAIKCYRILRKGKRKTGREGGLYINRDLIGIGREKNPTLKCI
jgi:hypothetical protein